MAIDNPQSSYKALKQQSRLATWPDSELRELASSIERVILHKDNLVFDTTFQSDDAYIIHAGQVQQSFLREKKELWHRTLSKGDIFVQQSLFRGQRYASVAQASPDAILFRIRAATLSELLTRHPELWSIFYAGSAARLQAMPLLRSLDDEHIETLATAVEEREFNRGQRICTATDPNGSVWLIDTGQVRITQQMATAAAGLGTVAVPRPLTPNQTTPGSQALPLLLTAGNFFVGGLIRIPNVLTVTAEAATQAKLLRIPKDLIEQFGQRFPDVTYMLTHPIDIMERLTSTLRNEAAFAKLNAQQWQCLVSITGWEHVPSGLDVTRQGQYGTKLYVLSDGEALVRSTDDSGRDYPRHVMQRGPEGYYGLTAMELGDRHGATVRSVVGRSENGGTLDGSDWLTLQRDDLHYVLESSPQLWEKTNLWHVAMVQPKQKDFKWQEDQEVIELHKRRSLLWLWLRLAGSGTLAMLAAAVTLILGGLADWSPLSAVLAFLFVLIPMTLWFIVDYFNDYYVITNRRIIRHDRVFPIYENQLEAPLARIQDITTRGSIIAKIFNYGYVDIRTAGVGSVTFDMIPDPDEVIVKIKELQSQVKAGSKAEQIENLRNQIIKTLGMRLTPSIPNRVLPVTMVVTPPLRPRQQLAKTIAEPFHAIRRWLKSIPRRIQAASLHLLPQRARQRVIKERQEKTKRREAQMQEVVVYRKHIFFLIQAAIIPIVTIGAAIALRLILRTSILSVLPPWLDIVYLIVMVVMVFWLWYRIENWRNDKYILTKTHIIDVYALPLGLFEQRRQAEWDRVQNANYKVPSFWANLFNYGDVIVETAAVEGRLDFIHVPNPRKVQQEIVLRIGEARQAQERRERERRQTDLSETLQIYNELIQEWARRNQQVSQSPPTAGRVPPEAPNEARPT